MKTEITLLFFLIISTIQAQFCDDPFEQTTYIKTTTRLTSEPKEKAYIYCKVRKKQEVKLLCYVENTEWWWVETKKCSGYIKEKYLVLRQDMSIYKNYVNEEVAWKNKRKQELAEASKAEAERVAKVKRAEQAKLAAQKAKLAEQKAVLKRKKESEAKSKPYVKSYSSSSRSRRSHNYLTGPRGGCYYINSNGNKSYVDRSFCGTTVRRSSARNSGYYRGPRGGCYRYTSGGNKKYVSRSMCN